MESSRKIKVYLDTSVISYLDQQDAPERMKDSQDIWKLLKAGKYDAYISDIVLRELGECKEEAKKVKLFSFLSEIKYNLIPVDESVVALAKRIIENGILTNRHFDDCEHIAAAILSDCDFVVSWNFKHIVNVKTIRGIKVITAVEGYKELMIYPPTALLDEED